MESRLLLFLRVSASLRFNNAVRSLRNAILHTLSLRCASLRLLFVGEPLSARVYQCGSCVTARKAAEEKQAKAGTAR